MKTLIFDFDGVIGDTYEMVVGIMDNLSAEFGFDQYDKEEIKKLRKLGLKKTIETLKISSDKLPLLLKKVREEQARRFYRLKLFSGIKEVLEKLDKAGYSLGILTSNSEKNIKTALLDNHLEVFDFVISESGFFEKSEILGHIIKDRRLKQGDVFYVGDETRDLEAAKKAGIKSVAVSWGYDSVEVLNQLKPDYLLSKPEDLIQILKEVK